MAFMGFLAGAVVLGAIGCGFAPGQDSTSGTAGAAGGTGAAGSGGAGAGTPGCWDDPAQGPPLDECGVWASTSLGDDANPGTQAAPVASLAKAIELAKQGTRHVYACGETWKDP